MTDLDLDKAAQATRRFHVAQTLSGGYVVVPGGERLFYKIRQAEYACDRLNLAAVLEAIREPIPSVVMAGGEAYAHQIPAAVVARTWRAMVDALIAEVKETTDAD